MSHQDCRVGELRPSQIVFSYGPGALVDLPHVSAVVLGLSEWDAARALLVDEPRLLKAVRKRLGDQVEALRSPPRPPDSEGRDIRPFDKDNLTGITVSPFPRWMLCPRCRLLAPLNSSQFRFRPDGIPDRVRFEHDHCQSARTPTVVPARFLTACPRGHLDDFPWRWFVHGGNADCKGQLALFERGASGEARDILVKCLTCEKSMPMALAFSESGKQTMPACRGRRIHLGDHDPNGCSEQAKAILMGASNLWFAESRSALAIPVEGDALERLIAETWSGSLEKFDTQAKLETVLGLGLEAYRAFHGYPTAQVWAAIERYRNKDGEPEASDLKGPEWDVLTRPGKSPDTADFRLRSVKTPRGFEPLIESVVLVERLREVRAITGFTRIAPPDEGNEVDRVVPLSATPPRWVPAAEVRGEGLFLRLRESAIETWSRTPGLTSVEIGLLASHTAWRKARRIENPAEGFPGLRFALLHSFAHALIRQLAMASGYGAASLRERIYSGDASDEKEAMAGILIYTAAPDSEGTLGGLVALGRPEVLRNHLLHALEGAERCSSDPLCAEHAPGGDGRTIHGAACHACAFVSETSCEAGNRYLDRSLIVNTDHAAHGFFAGVARE